MPQSCFNPLSEVARLAELRKSSRKNSRFRSSRLDRFSFELLQLHQAGAKTVDLQRWLREHHIKVNFTTVSRWLKKNTQVAQA